MRNQRPADHHRVNLEPLEQRLLLAAVVAQSGFNDATGALANGTADSPYNVGSLLINQGGDEPGWARPWTSGFSRASVQGTTKFEGDGAIFFPAAGDFVTRRFTVAQTGQFTFDFRIRFNAGGFGDVRLWRDLENESIDAGVGPTVLFNSNGTITVRDGQGGGNELTGLNWTANQWHHVQIIANASTLSWRLIVNGNEYVGPDTLGFLQNEPVMDAVFFSVNNGYVDDVQLIGAPLAPFGPDNLLMANTDFVSEYTLAGQLVQQFSIHSPDQVRPEAMDLDLDLTGRVHIFNERDGVAFLSTFTPATGAWEHHTFDDWAMHNVTYYGGIAVTNTYVYAPDSGSGGDPGGVIRLDLSDLSDIVRLESAVTPHYVSLGLDGFLYLLDKEGDVAKYEADSFTLVTQYPFQRFMHGSTVTAIAVDSNGDIYTSDLDNDIYRHDNAGNLLDTNSDDIAHIGMMIRADGKIITGSGGNFVGVTDRDFSSSFLFQSFDNGDFNPHFVAFTVPQIPSGLPLVSVTALDASAAETAGGTPNPGLFRITRTGDADEELVVSFTITGATNGVDHVLIPSPVVIPAGASFIDIALTPLDDAEPELNEVVLLTLVDAAGYDVGTLQAAVTITDNEPPAVSIAALDAGAAEGAGTGAFRISRGGGTDTALSVAFTVSGTATSGADFTALSSPVVIPIGASFVDVVVTATNDVVPESAETVIVALTAGAAYSLVGSTEATVTITDNDGTLITIEALDATASENADTGTIRITRTGSASAALNVNILRSGTAGFGVGKDYTQSVSGVNYQGSVIHFASGVSSVDVVIHPLDDALFEAAETAAITLATGTGYLLPALAADRVRAVTIADNEMHTFSIADVAVTETNSGAKSATFTVKLSGKLTGPVTVDYATAAGTATEGADYTAAAGTLTFLAGQTSKTFTVPIVGDLIDEDDQTFFINLSSASGAGIADGQALATIKDNDAGPKISINDVTVSESDDANADAVFALTLSVASERTITVTAATGVAPGAASLRAIDGADFLALSPTVFTFSPGQTSIPLAVAALPDDVAEANEKFAVNLTLPVGATIQDKQGLATISDDDAPSVSISDAEVTEVDRGNVNAAFTVSLSHASTVPVTVKFSTAASSPSSATPSTDYTTQTNKTVTFAPGETSKIVNVAVKGDPRDEPDETFLVNLSAPVSATLADAQGTGTILDNDATPTLTINDVTTSEGDAGTKNITFTVKLSAASGQVVTVDYATADGSAAAGSDYTATLGTLTFNPGVTSQKVSVTITGDLDPEDHETFTLDLTNATNATIADAAGLATLTSEEFAPADINGLILDAIIASGRAPLATTGSFSIEVSDDGTSYAMFGDGDNVGDSTGTLTYLRTGKKTGKVTFTDNVLGAGTILLTFISTTQINYTMTVAGGGSQRGAMTLG